MTVNLEKIFFAYVLRNKKYFSTIEPYFFKNKDIKFVYQIVRNYVMKSTDIIIPSPKQISEMVRLEDIDNTITSDMLLSMLKVDLKEYDENNFIKPKLNTWILVNRVKNSTSDIVDDSRELDGITDYNEALKLASKIKDKINEGTSTRFDSDDTLGSDFDDVEAHVQDLGAAKVKTGWESLDAVLAGGWDVKTFNIIMGSTNSGKCSLISELHIRNKKTNQIEKIKIEEFFKKCKYGKRLDR